jgi:hypothetical protein
MLRLAQLLLIPVDDQQMGSCQAVFDLHTPIINLPTQGWQLSIERQLFLAVDMAFWRTWCEIITDAGLSYFSWNSST